MLEMEDNVLRGLLELPKLRVFRLEGLEDEVFARRLERFIKLRGG